MTDNTMIQNLGYAKKLCVLPFDHRSYFEELLGFHEPLSEEQTAQLSEYKKIVYAAYEKSLTQGVSINDSAILVDDVFGLEILLDAKKKGYTTLQSTEISGIDHFEFEHGADWQSWIEKVKPTFVKVLIRYNVEGDKALNAITSENLKKLSDYSHEHGYKFLIEALVPATASQLATVGGDKKRFDHELRPLLAVNMIKELHAAKIEPDVWKIEGMYDARDYQNVVQAARENERVSVGIVTLGRNETDEVVEKWLKISATVPGVIGFAVGRTIFLNALLAYRSKKYSYDQAVDEISQRFIHFYNVFNA